MNQRDSVVPMSDTEVEAQVKQKGLTAPRITNEHIDGLIINEVFHQFPGTTLIVCALTLKNGFVVTGESAAASPENFNEEIGQGIAKRNARDKIWSLVGYALRCRKLLIEQSRPLVEGDLIFMLGTPTTYIGTKVVYAVPMNRLKYNELRGWQLPADENGEDEGYLVEYADGGSPNVVGFGGYVSWSPKDVFEGSYKEFGTAVATSAPTFIDRLVKEHSDLASRTEKLAVFLITDDFAKLDKQNQSLLREQHQVMIKFLSVLDQRISLLKG